ncbi:restriction endonuclease [Clostridium ganghwense]|uniref:Restriction endonuclease n=1 Tax=Clostridium ganghwense TaxID=312089 RepID=A0ABT4CTS2_9CLOT|nr:restriction endonuclease [Clostridium ganghwense]MCY6372480.1 restriction endonuclease [Clostridium ganghwense]
MNSPMDILIGYFVNLMFIVILGIALIKFIILFAKCLHKIINMFIYYRQEKKRIDNLKQGILTLEDLHDLSPNEFEHWCASFLDKQGYTNIEVTPVGPDGGKDIICYRGNLKFYVECKRYVYSKKAKYKVDLEIARKLVGAMEGNQVVDGMIITSGIITNEAIEYINSLPECFDIKLYDGKDLLKEYDNFRKLSPVTIKT